ncbi:DUF4384 domain-containing protein [Nostoc sp. CCY0012]|uniref:DUF4384 domain-containing protein n=1 Tax=Nostoc sp. CCY0012 TaxID=1056123 RepID=UPI0039C6A2CC
MLSIPFGELIKAIAGIAIPTVKNKFQRNEAVIKLLKQFNLEPDHPPSYFSGVYAYTLVEYGIGKPKPFLQLFQEEAITRAFRNAFDHNNLLNLLSEVDDFVEAYALGDEVKSLGIDIKREIAAFYIVFLEIAKRTRNPADTLMSQQIEAIQDKLESLPTLEGIRTEMARLLAQDYPVLPSGVNNDNLEPQQLWSKISEQISSTDKFYVLPLEIKKADIKLPGRKKMLPEYPLGTRIRCYIQLEQPSYVILLSKFTSGDILCVCPSSLVFKNYHQKGEFVCPDPKHDECPYFELDGNLGIEEWIAITSSQKPIINWLPQDDSELSEQDPMELSSLELNDLLNYVKNEECEVMGFKYKITA